MLRSLWIAKTGMESQQTNIDVISHNLANVSTTGFKRSRAVFEDLLYQTIQNGGFIDTRDARSTPAIQAEAAAKTAQARARSGGRAARVSRAWLAGSSRREREGRWERTGTLNCSRRCISAKRSASER